MPAHYRTVFFRPDPVNGSQFAIAAIFETPEGQGVVVAEHLPGPECLGGRSFHRTMCFVAEDLREAGASPRGLLPETVGSHARLGPLSPLPETVARNPDAAQDWLQRVLFRTPPKDTKSTVVRRDVEGIRFFESYGLGDYVKKRYVPQGRVRRLPQLAPVTHYVEGRGALFLMEPILLRKRPASVDKEIADVSGKLTLYATVANRLDAEQVRCLAYVLPGGAKETREHTMSRLGESREWIQAIDLDTTKDRDRFLRDIEQVALPLA